MRREIFLIISVIMLVGSSCHRHTEYPASMLRAVELMDVQPDSALKLLHTVDSVIHSYDEEARYYHRLLTIQAEDKCDVFHESDSLVNTLISYYENHYNTHKLALAYYYKGRINADLGKPEEAVPAFHTAIKYGRKTKDYPLLGRMHSQLSQCIMYYECLEEAYSSELEALRYFQLASDTPCFPYTYRNFARYFNLKKKNDSAEFYYDKAYNLALHTGDSNKIYSILGEYGAFMHEVGKRSEAFSKLISASKWKIRMPNVDSHLGIMYLRFGNYDSAKYYLQFSLSMGDGVKKANSLNALSLIEQGKGNTEEAFDYYKKMVHTKDSTIGKEYQSKKEFIKNYYYQEKDKSKASFNSIQILIFFLFTIVSIIVTGLVLMRFYRNRTNAGQKVIVDKKRLIESDIYSSIFYNGATNNNINWQQWDELITDIYPLFYATLKTLCPKISTDELHICSLVKLGMGNRQLAVVFCITAAAMSNKKRRLQEKFTDSELSTKKLEDIVSKIS